LTATLVGVQFWAGGGVLARKNRDDWVQGPPGSKLKLNNMRGGMGTALLVLEQTLLNLPQGEVDQLTSEFRELMQDAVKLVKVRMKDLLGDRKQRVYVKLNDVSSALIQFTQAYQTLVGYTTRAMEVPVDAVQEALNGTDRDIRTVEGFLAELDAKIEEAKRKMELEAGDSVIDLEGVEVTEAPDQAPLDVEDVVTAGQLQYMRRNGYLTEDNRWTGLEPGEGAPEFVALHLEKIRAAGEARDAAG
jgi:hypothetical protein